MIHDDTLPRGIMLQKSIDIFRQVEHDDDDHQHRHREEESAYELEQYVTVESFHSLLVILGIMSAFHAVKSPSTMCLRASLTSQR